MFVLFILQSYCLHMLHVIAILCVKEFTCPARGNNRVLKFGIKSWSFVTQNWGLLQEVKSIKKTSI